MSEGGPASGETVAEIIARRDISEVLHFTTNTGLLGMLAAGGILSRHRLPEEKYIEKVYEPNAKFRKDHAWLDYVNLSIGRINTEFFGHSSRWHAHRKVWWCVLSLDPAILTHDGVVFTTTNNIYTGVERATGASGLEALFAPKVVRWQGNVITRDQDLPLAYPTCIQAEVLYPERVPTEFLRRVYVATPEHADIVGSQIEILSTAGELADPDPEIQIDIRPDIFGA